MINHMKKILFFDGDGTLWYPESTKYAVKPHWVYLSPKTASDPNKHLMLTPTAVTTIKLLRQKGIITVLLSTHPRPSQEASRILHEKVRHFCMSELFDEIHVTQPHESSKGEFMMEILTRRNIPKKDALMVGDTYEWDYATAVRNGIDAVLIESQYQKEHPKGRNVRRTISALKDVLKYVQLDQKRKL